MHAKKKYLVFILSTEQVCLGDKKQKAESREVADDSI
jgi:hypothetical protein